MTPFELTAAAERLWVLRDWASQHDDCLAAQIHTEVNRLLAAAVLAA